MAGPVLGVRCDRGKPRGTFKFPATQLWSGQHTANSSPPSRPSTSDSRNVCFEQHYQGESGQRPVTLSMTEAVIDLLKEVQVEE
jgi:hypothetical protein